MLRRVSALSPGSVQLLIAWAAVVCAWGCGGGPPALYPPDIDPQSSADAALEMYDEDGDGSLSAAELEACPGLKKMLKSYDLDSSETISHDELQGRLQLYLDSGAAIIPLSAKIRYNNRPLEGATVRFVPESYFDGTVKEATGITGKSGSARMAVAAEDLPENQRNIRGIQIGTYRVEITHPEINIPAKYNTATTLGFEPIFGQPNIEFRIQGKDKTK